MNTIHLLGSGLDGLHTAITIGQVFDYNYVYTFIHYQPRMVFINRSRSDFKASVFVLPGNVKGAADWIFVQDRLWHKKRPKGEQPEF